MRNYFDWLPDELVMEIIGRLNWKDAGKTCVVSHRFCNVFGYVCDQKLLNEKNLNLEDKTNVRFVDFVNHVLQAHKRSTVDSLKIALVGHYNIYSDELVEDDYVTLPTLPRNILTPGYVGYNRLFDNQRDQLKKRKIYAKAKDDFDGWMRFAKDKCVKSLELSRYGLDAQVAPLYPAFPLLEAWDQLTSLTLKSVHAADLWHGLYRGMKNLESLILEDSLPGPLFREDGSPLVVLYLHSPKLKRLEIRQCGLGAIKLYLSPNLEYFRCVPLDGAEPVDYNLDLALNMLPKLSHIYLTYSYFIGSCMLELQKQGAAKVLEELELLVDSTTYTRHNFLELQLVGNLTLNFPTNNKRCNPLRVFEDMIVVYPKLHKLTLVYYKWDEEMYDFFVESHGTHGKHYCLKEVEFVGWCGNKDEDGVVNFLKQIAPNLEKIHL